MTQTTLAPPLRLDHWDPQALLAYYQRAWALEDRLWQSLVGDDPFYLNPDPLRNLLIFYLGHTAVFYINKLQRVGLLQRALQPAYEELFSASGGYRYRALFDEIRMPWQYPVEVNYHEAVAYCGWYNQVTGHRTRLMGEAEWQRTVWGDPQPVSDYNTDIAC